MPELNRLFLESYINEIRGIRRDSYNFYEQNLINLKVIQDDCEIIQNTNIKQEKLNNKLNKEEVVFNKEEINKALCKESALNVLLKDLRKSSLSYDRIRFYQLGEFYYGKLKGETINLVYLILGIQIDGIIYEDNDIIYEKSKSKFNNYSYITYDVKQEKIKIIDSYNFNNSLSKLSGSDEIRFFNKLKFRIKDSALSGKVFGYGTIKKDLIGVIIDGKTNNICFDRGISLKLAEDTEYAIVLHKEKNINVKFCICDIEVVLPSLKGYNFPIDKTISVGNDVVIKSETNKVYKVLKIYSNTTSKRISKNSTNKKLDVFVISNIKEPSIIKKVYCKNIKKLK